MNNHTYHMCKNSQMRPGTREACPRCTPQNSKTNEIIVKQAARIVELQKENAEMAQYIAWANGRITQLEVEAQS
jgi:methylphosphotriester-DNA--protein-cysteine methyltransferase